MLPYGLKMTVYSRPCLSPAALHTMWPRAPLSLPTANMIALVTKSATPSALLSYPSLQLIFASLTVSAVHSSVTTNISLPQIYFLHFFTPLASGLAKSKTIH